MVVIKKGRVNKKKCWLEMRQVVKSFIAGQVPVGCPRGMVINKGRVNNKQLFGRSLDPISQNASLCLPNA